jgi:hypothetical protein
MSRAAWIGVLAVAALLLAACGSSSSSSGSASAGSSAASANSLTVTYWADGSQPASTTSTYTGSLDAKLLEPVPATAACTMIYGGPQKATVTGTLEGQAVNATFERSNGCEIARWDAMAKAGVLPSP